MAMALSLLCGSAWAAELDPVAADGEPAAGSSVEEAVEAEALAAEGLGVLEETSAEESEVQEEATAAESEASGEVETEKSVEESVSETTAVEAEKSDEIQVLSIVVSGTCGNNVTWTLDSEGTLTISGMGEMSDGLGESFLSSYYLTKVKNVNGH